MAQLKVTVRARADVKALLASGQQLFGPIQVRRYAMLIESAYLALMEAPLRGHTRISPRRGTRVLALRQPGVQASHVIVYTYSEARDLVTILRVLHERADLKRHVP